MGDDYIRLLAIYLEMNPSLRSIILDNNNFTDEGFNRLIDATKKNNKLAHISFKDCERITEASF